jgi:nitrogen fixation NifU-like protein
MMLDLVIGRTTDDAKRLAEIFLRMIKGKITDEERDELEEAGVLEDISHMPARVKCAVLGWHTMQEIIDDPDKAKKGFKQIHP